MRTTAFRMALYAPTGPRPTPHAPPQPNVRTVFSDSTTSCPSRVVSLKTSSSAASTQLPSTSQTSPMGDSGSSVWTTGSV